jgi:hypothetical protein
MKKVSKKLLERRGRPTTYQTNLYINPEDEKEFGSKSFMDIHAEQLKMVENSLKAYRLRKYNLTGSDTKELLSKLKVAQRALVKFAFSVEKLKQLVRESGVNGVENG